MKHFNNLTPSEAERIALLMEECSEVIQICGKILRHGYESYNPFDELRLTNRSLLEKEVSHVEFAINLMSKQNKDIDRGKLDLYFHKKSKNVWQYLHHNKLAIVRGERNEP